MMVNAAWRRLAAVTAVYVLAFGAVVLAPAAPAAAVVAPVRDLYVDSPVSAQAGLLLGWVLPSGATDALVCYNVDKPAPVTPGVADTCLPPVTDRNPEFDVDAEYGRTYAVTVWSHVASTNEYGPGVSKSVVASAYAIDIDDVWMGADTETSLRMCAGSEEGAPDHYVVRIAAGTKPPGGTPERVVTLPGTGPCPVIDALVPHAPYTFDVRAVNEAGEGSPYLVTAATRTSGAWLDSPAGMDLVSPLWYSEAAIAVARGGREHAVVSLPVPGTHRLGPAYRTRSSGGQWSQPVLLDRAQLWDERAMVSVNRRGDVLVGWNNSSRASYRVRASASGQWGKVHRIAKAPGSANRLDGAVIDDRGRLHFLVNRYLPDDSRDALYYRTNAGGRWTDGVLSPQTCPTFTDHDGCANALLAYDDVTERVVVVEQHTVRRTIDGQVRRVSEVRFTSAPAARASLPRMRVIHTSRTDRIRLLPSSLSARAGRVAVGMRGSAPRGLGPSSRGAAYLLTQTTHGRWRLHLMGAKGESPIEVRVAVINDRHVAMAWQVEANWDIARQGVWATTARRPGSPTFWRADPPRHVSDSAYDHLRGLAVDGHGRARVSFVRW